MLKQWLSWINISIGSLAAFLLVVAGIMAFMHPEEVAVSNLESKKRALPVPSFTMPKQAYDAICKSCLDLKFSPLLLQLPDLRNHIIYYGKNGRPDAKADRTVLHFAFTGNANLSSVMAGEKLYLLFDRTKVPNQYVFSPNNAPTSLWIEPVVEGNEAIINVRMKTENGDIIREPAAYAQIRLPEKEGARVGGRVWEMGKWRVDGSLLARQKASWKGQDRFLERHGGEEFQSLLGKHRIDFTEEEENYSVYVGLNDSLIWKDDRWHVVKPGDDSLNYPLMAVKKIDERLMSFELWEVGGKGKVILNLIRTNEPWVPQTIVQNFTCLGARTRSQYIFEIAGQRMLLNPKDWLLQTPEGWIKLDSEEAIDDFVERRETGVLFIFDGVVRKEGKQMLSGVMFNPSRTEMEEIEIPVQQGGAARAVVDDNKEDDDEDDDDEDDEVEVETINGMKKMKKTAISPMVQRELMKE